MPEGRFRGSWADVDLDALRHNASVLRQLAAPAELCAVVKAGGYGHGAVPIARAALEGGASRLAVVTVEEGIELRQGGIDAPVLLLPEIGPDAMLEALAHRLTPTIFTDAGLETARHAVSSTGHSDIPVHVKVDTGMHRLGADQADAVALAQAAGGAPGLELEGLWTHLAVADEPDDPYTDDQLSRFEAVRAKLAQVGVVPSLVHAANSAGTIGHPRSRYDMVRCGIALYGCPPASTLEALLAEAGFRLRPVLSLRARVSMTRPLDAGERPSYGRRRPLPVRSVVATAPLGYADGVPRRLFDTGGEVLLGGRRRPLAGRVTMDHIVIDCGPESGVAPGDEVVLIGRQGSEEVTADEWARRLGTISYEVLTSIGPRVPRMYRDARRSPRR
jgi:alanine racemase